MRVCVLRFIIPVQQMSESDDDDLFADFEADEDGEVSTNISGNLAEVS